MARETALLLHHDTQMHAIPGGKHPDPESVQLETLSDESLSVARELMRAELAGAMGFPGANEEALRRLVGASLEDDEEALESLEAALKQRSLKLRGDKANLVEELALTKVKMAGIASQAAKAKRRCSKCRVATRQEVRHFLHRSRSSSRRWKKRPFRTRRLSDCVGKNREQAGAS